jgi:hypothetical protein
MPLQYQSGFGNNCATEALPGAPFLWGGILHNNALTACMPNNFQALRLLCPERRAVALGYIEYGPAYFTSPSRRLPGYRTGSVISATPL